MSGHEANIDSVTNRVNAISVQSETNVNSTGRHKQSLSPDAEQNTAKRIITLQTLNPLGINGRLGRPISSSR